MKKIITTFFLLLINTYAFSVTTTGTPPSCTSPEVLQYYISTPENSHLVCTMPSGCVSAHYSSFSADPPSGFTGSVYDTVSINYGINSSIQYREGLTRTSTGELASVSTFNMTVNSECIITEPEQKCSSEQTVSGLNIISEVHGTKNDTGGAYTCYTNSDGDLCGFNVPSSEILPNTGTVGESVRAILHQRGGRNGGKKINGSSSNAECSEEYQASNPFASSYANVSITNDIQSSTTVGNIKTVTLEDGTKVDIVMATASDAADGLCIYNGCIKHIEETETGKDYVVITAADIDPPDTVYEATLGLSTSNPATTDPSQATTDVTTLHLLSTETTDTPIKGEIDNTDTSLISDSALSIFGSSSDGTGTGTGDGGSGDGGTGDGDGGSGDGEGDTNVTVVCGGTTGVSCESTQAQVLATLVKLDNAQDASLVGGSEDCSVSPTCTGRDMVCANMLVNWRLACLAKVPSTAQVDEIDQSIKDEAINAGVTFDQNGKPIIPSQEVDVSSIIDYSGIAGNGAEPIWTYSWHGHNYSIDTTAIYMLMSALGSLVLLSVGIHLFRNM